jgi:uncharacterized membrane protein YccC
MPKNPGHVTGDGNDGDTTILYKALAMAHGIALPKAQAQSMRRHNDARNALRWAIGIACAGIVVIAFKWIGALAWIERVLPR